MDCKHKIDTAYTQWEKRLERELKFLFAQRGEELQLCLIAQGYKSLLFGRLIVLFGSGFTAIEIIKNLEEKIKDGN